MSIDYSERQSKRNLLVRNLHYLNLQYYVYALHSKPAQIIQKQSAKARELSTSYLHSNNITLASNSILVIGSAATI
jgi:hypothetical protein